MRTSWIVVGSLLALAGCNPASSPSDGDAIARDDASTDASFDPDAGDPGTDADPGTTPRDFTLRGRAMDTFAGRSLGVWVVETTGGREMGFARFAALSGAEVELRLPDLVPEGDYRADVFVDGNGNGTYDGPAIDPSWPVTVPAHGSATAMFAGTDATMDLSASPRTPRTDFTATLSGFTADETGHWFELRVIDQSSRATVGGFVAPQVSSSVTITLPGVLDDGSAYNVDFWVDMDSNQAYSGASVDHAWRVPINGTSMTWTHSDTSTELDWR